MTPTPVQGIALSTVGIVSTLASFYYVREFYLRPTVTKLAVAGPEDPVLMTRSGFFGGSIERSIPRATLRGIPISITSERLSQTKSFPFRVAGFNKFFLLDKRGLFDNSGVLNSVLGYDMTTFQRCPPSPMSVDEEREQNKLDAVYLAEIKNKMKK